LARCLNPRSHHDNPPDKVTCQYCEFLVQGAHIGTYEVVDFIGTGSYGHVYKICEPNPLERTLALKVLRTDQASARSSFFQEARRIANMQHSNILPIYSFGLVADSQQPYFVMEYAPRTINDLFKRDDPQGSTGAIRRLAFAEELVPYVQQCAHALSFVHDNGFVHQDVKPANLLIGRNGQILLADFGTAYYLGMQTHASLGEITGTAAYMPPEQWQGAPRRSSDQYALAICCYELLSGRPPFNYRQLDAMFQAHLKEAPPAPQRWNPRIPVEVSAVLLRALAKDYRQRYPSIDDFAENYSNAVEIALQRYRCLLCGQQNRTGAQRCAFCGAAYDGRDCQYCGQAVHFGQRCCSHCGRLTLSPHSLQHNPLVGVSVRQGRYTTQRILKQSEETGIVVAQSIDERSQQLVVLKRWECASAPLTQRASDIAYYERATQPLTRLRHPLVPRILDRFAEGPYYYAVMNYIDGESLAERMQKLLRPLPEREVLGYLNTLLNILEALGRMQPAIHHYDISPANILIEYQRGRVFLTGFQVPPPLQAQGQAIPLRGRRTTRKLAISPYQPIQDRPYDQRSCIYALAASMHHALTNVAPPHYPSYPPVRLLNTTISPALEYILSRALLEDPHGRYQSYSEMRKDVQRLLA
jgi:Serine/threonine protein kinase